MTASFHTATTLRGAHLGHQEGRIHPHHLRCEIRKDVGAPVSGKLHVPRDTYTLRVQDQADRMFVSSSSTFIWFLTYSPLRSYHAVCSHLLIQHGKQNKNTTLKDPMPYPQKMAFCVQVLPLEPPNRMLTDSRLFDALCFCAAF